VEADCPAWAGADPAIPNTASAPVIANKIAVPLTILSSSWERCGASTASIEACCFEHRLFRPIRAQFNLHGKDIQLVRPRPGSRVFASTGRQMIDEDLGAPKSADPANDLRLQMLCSPSKYGCSQGYFHTRPAWNRSAGAAFPKGILSKKA
jgi:hypothetical protein